MRKSAFLFFLLLASPQALASGPYLELLGGAVSGEGVLQAEARVAPLWQIGDEHEVFVGPNAGWEFGGGPFLGAQAKLWSVNLVGFGVHAELADVSSQSAVSLRFGGELGMRLLHLNRDGAVQIELGPSYDTLMLWQFRMAFSIQFAGIPAIGL